MATGQQTTFDDIQKSLEQFRTQKQKPAAAPPVQSHELGFTDRIKFGLSNLLGDKVSDQSLSDLVRGGHPAAMEPPPKAPQDNAPQSQFMAVPNPQGLIEPGNLPIWNRPVVKNADGSRSTEYSISNRDERIGAEVLVPTVVNGKFLTPDGKKPPEGSAEEKAMKKRAWQHYIDTGENLGKFKGPDEATAYAHQLHNRQDQRTAQPSAFDSLTKELNDRRQQRGDKTPVTISEPTTARLSPQENAQQVIETGRKVLDWKNKQIDRLGDWVVSKNTKTPEEIKADLDRTPKWQLHLAHLMFGGGKYDEEETKRNLQATGEVGSKLIGWADKQVTNFVADPVNIAMMLSGTMELHPLLSLAIDGYFTAAMSYGAYTGIVNAYQAGKAANWDVFPTFDKDGHLHQKPEAAAFWEAVGDTTVSGFFAGMGAMSMPHRAGLVREYGKFSDPKLTGINKSWSDMSQAERATALANVQRHDAEKGKGLDAAQRHQQLAQELGLKPKPKDQAEAAAQYAEATSEVRARLAQAQKHADDLRKADIAIATAPEKRAAYDMEPPPILGEVREPKQSKIWTPEGEREVTTLQPSVSAGRDLAVMNPQDREYVRQQARERQAHEVLQQEQQRRQQEYVRKATQFREESELQKQAFETSLKREAERRQKAAEEGLKVEEKRPLAWDTQKAEQIAETERVLGEQMDRVANENMFEHGADQYLKYLRRPNRDRPYTDSERDFLRMAEEREILRHYSDPSRLSPVATGVGTERIPVAKPSVPTMRDRLQGVTSVEQARQVLDGATDDQIAELMVPLNQAFAKEGTVYAHAGERPLFTDSRGDMHEGSSWTPHEGVETVATVPVHPDDLPKWAIAGDKGKFILQVMREGDGVFGTKEYVEPQVLIGQVDPAAPRGSWDWTDWAAAEKNRRENAFLEELLAVDRQNDLENAAVDLGIESHRADTPEKAEQLAKDAQEADNAAKAIIEERREEEAKSAADRYPEKAPVKELARGRETEVTLPSGRKLKAHYAIVSLDDAIPSHLVKRKFEPNEKYVGWNEARTQSLLQPNDYKANKERQEMVLYRASLPDFGQIFNTTSAGTEGPPVLRRDGIVAGGNGRTMILQELYSRGRGNEIVNAIEETKGHFGIDAPTPSFEDSPAIVRVLDEPLETCEDLVKVGNELNRDQMTKRNRAEDAAATALYFNQEFLDWIANAFDAMDEDATLRSFMERHSETIGKKFLDYGIISPNERGQFIDGQGKLTPDAKTKFERAIRGVVIKDPAALAALEQPGMANFAVVIDKALPGLMRMVAKGGTWDIHDYLPQAIREMEKVNDAKPALEQAIKLAADHGQKAINVVDVFLHPDRVKGTTRPLGEFAPEHERRVDPITESLMRTMLLKPLEAKEAFARYAADAEGKQASLSPLLPWESFDKNIGSKVGVEVQESDWGRTEPKVEAKPTAAPLPPEVAEVPTPLPDWITENRGRWFTPDLQTAKTYASDNGKVMAVDVPESIANDPDVSLGGRKEHVLPDVWMKKSVPLDQAGEVPAGMVRLYRGEKPYEAAAKPLESPPAPPAAGAPEQGGIAPPPALEQPFSEESLRSALEQHGNLTPAMREGMIQVWKLFSEKYLGMPFDQFLRQHWTGVKVGGEYGGEEGLQQAAGGAVNWAYHPQKGILSDRAGRKSHEQLLHDAGVDSLVGRAFDRMPRGKAMVDPYSRSVVVTLEGEGDLSPAAERELKHALDVPDNYTTRVNYGPRVLFQEANPVWYSKLDRTMQDEKLPAAGTGEQWLRMLENKGVKKGEIEAVGIDDFLKGKKKVTKQELQDFIRENQVQVSEVVKAAAPPPLDEQGRRISDNAGGLVEAPNQPKFNRPDTTLPGGENYRELLLTLPLREGGTEGPRGWGDTAGGTASTVNFRGGHFDEPNVLAHVRFNDRTDADGKRVLFMEELQSDWHQKGRKKGYRATEEEIKRLENIRTEAFAKVRELIRQADNLGFDSVGEASRSIGNGSLNPESIDETGVPGLRDAAKKYREAVVAYHGARDGVPDAPFKTDWHELAMKRMIRWAVDHGYDKIAWTTGEMQNERYDLSKHINRIAYESRGDGKTALWIMDKNEAPLQQEMGERVPGSEWDDANKATVVPNSALPDLVGKEVAEKILNDQGTPSQYWASKEITGVNLKIGGSGMKGFYDKMLPAFADKYGKKFGAKVGETEIPIKSRDTVGERMDQVEDAANRMFGKSYDELSVHQQEEVLKATESATVHSLDITPAMRKAVMEGQPLFQEHGVIRGLTEFKNDGQAVMKLFEQANFSTFAHESFHIMRRHLKPGDAEILGKWAGAKDNVWNVQAEEKAARAWERYLRDGKAPTKELSTLFAKLRAWLTAVYRTIKGTPLDLKISDDVRGVFDRMLTGEESPEAARKIEEPPKAPTKDKRFIPQKQRPPAISDEYAKELGSQEESHKYQWMANKEGGQKFGNRELIVPVNRDIYENIVRNLTRDNPTFEKHQELYPDLYVSFIQHEGKGPWQLNTVNTLANLVPDERAVEREGWARQVESFDTAEAKKHGSTADSDKLPVQELDKPPSAVPALEEPPLPGFEAAVGEQAEAAAAHRAEELSGEIAAPKGDISRATGEMETKSPLFRGTEASPQNEMFAPLSPEEKKDVQQGLGLPDQLFQDDSKQARDLKLRMIRDKLKDPTLTGDFRRKLERMQAELQGEVPQVEQQVPKGTKEVQQVPKRAAEPLAPTPKKTVRIWTPHGEIEVEREEPRRETPKADQGRGAVDVADRDKEPRRLEPLPERPEPAARGDEKQDTGRSTRPATEGGRGRDRRGTDRESLPTVAPANVDPPKRERGVPLYSPQEWKNKLSTFMLPENMPAPFVALDNDIARLLIFPGQKELAESALSGLKQHDAYILGTATGTGKTYLASSIVSQIMRRDKPRNVLILTPSQNLVSDFKNVLLDFDVEAKSLPDGVAAPDEPGVFVSTYATANLRDGIERHPWDLVVMDEADAARRWYSSQQGQMAKTMGEHAGKVLYMSATPFHTALELGHMTKLGLWNREGFDLWGKQFGIYKDKNGNYGGGNAPRKLVALRQQLIERGQFAQLDRQMDGYHPNFLLVPLTAEDKVGLQNIVEAFELAKNYYTRKGRMGMIRSLQGNMVTYMKSYLERRRLPQAIELAKRAEKEGYKTIIFSEHKAGRNELFSLLEEPDMHMDGQIKQLLPMIPDVVEELQKAFGNDIANFSGKHSTMRSEEKEAFIRNEKKHIYATYGAGGRGVSLHDTNGKYPRVAIYLGPPYSGVMLDQAIGRPWRFGTKSDVQAFFLLSNARDEVDLVIKKVGPRLESLRALVSGIDMTDPMTVAMRRLDEAHDGALSYDLGQEHSVDQQGLSTTYDHVPIMNWREAPVPPASEQMNKGMRLPGETAPHPGMARLMQAEEYELPGDMELPDKLDAEISNDMTAQDFAAAKGAPGLSGSDLEAIPAPQRAEMAESINLLADGAAKANPEVPQAAVRRTWDNAAKVVKMAQDLPPSKAGRSINWIWFTNGREVIRRAAERSGVPELGKELAKNIAEYHVETGNVAGPFQKRYYDITKKLSPEEHDNAWLVKEGATRKDATGKKVPVQPLNEKVVQAVKDTTTLLQNVKDLLAKERVYTEFYDPDTGRRMQVLFADQVDDPRYMPHRYDYNRKVTIEDPKTGQKETMTLREILKGKDLGQYRYERIVDSLSQEYGVSKAQVEDWLNRRKRDVPLMGNVERAREAGLPFYRTDPEAMIAYLEGVGETVARQRVFGQDRGKLEPKLLKIPEQRDRALVRDIFDSLLSRRHYDDDTRAFVHVAAGWEILSKMAFSALKIPFHVLHASLYTNGRTLLRTMFEGVTNYGEMKQRALYSGAVMEQMRAALASELGLGQTAASKLLRWNGFHSAYTIDRALANASARIWMDNYALPKLMKEPQNANMRRQLKDVYLLGDNQIDNAIANKRWNEDDYARSGKALSDKVMFTMDVTELPPGWRARSDDPIADSSLAAVRIATLLKSFMFKTGVILKDRLWTEAKQGNFRPWIPFLVFYPLAGEAIRQLSAAGTFSTKQADWWTQEENQEPAKILERAAEDIAYSTGMTSLMWLVQAPLGQKGWAIGEFFAGPFYSDLMHTLYKFPSELAAAKSDYAAHNAITRWLQSTVTASRPFIRLFEEETDWDPEAEKKKAQHEAGQRAAQTRRERRYGHGRG